MTNQHPIAPPPELVQQWSADIYEQTASDDLRDLYIATQAARWGADAELDACCEWLLGWTQDLYPGGIYSLRAARRPKPPSLKEQALALLDDASDRLDAVHENTIRRALEQLDD